MEAEKRLSFAGFDEGGGMLMLGLFMVVFVCSVLACIPFLRLDEAFVADKRVWELDLLQARCCHVFFPEPEMELVDVVLVRPVSSDSGICSVICSSAVFPGSFSAIPTIRPAL